ncbi:hypothetical protein TK90_2610 (plasmid) [Thioalkalivibrio sp. K90mix]|uniref:hypothetical protein n=1 Tax=Thioalkalivibrio sp. (strain K90mix) TaxID=396595 RepID=UPI000195AB1C|nr:hypothetical protein [Thioalkalivibrio sp. K90mix]ADC73097.1 hypothetical protein TK90_2610 [Thioalkalivibrio sp. K90mix]
MHCIGKRDDEVYVGNAYAYHGGLGVPEYLSHLKTARVGEKALDLDGNPLPPDLHRPLFIGQSEVAEYNRIKEHQLTRIRMGLGDDHV